MEGYEEDDAEEAKEQMSASMSPKIRSRQTNQLRQKADDDKMFQRSFDKIVALAEAKNNTPPQDINSNTLESKKLDTLLELARTFMSQPAPAPTPASCQPECARKFSTPTGKYSFCNT